MKNRKLKIRPVLIVINILLLIVIVSFYGIRMYKFAKAEHNIVDNVGETKFLSILTNKKSVVDLSKGLIYNEENETYTYKGKVEDNYLLYSGILFRIVGIDGNGNIKIVTDKNMTLMYSGLNNGFEESHLYSWLNSDEANEYSGVFDKVLYDKDSFIKTNTICKDVIEDLTNITCEEMEYIDGYTILSLKDYVESGGKEGYLNIEDSFYLSTLNESGNNYYVTVGGEIGTDTVASTIRGVRPVITINSDIKLLEGNGTKNKPYIIEKHNMDTLKDVYVGDIINYSNMNWKVIEHNEDSLRVALEGVIKDGENNLSKTFGGSSNVYSTTKKTIGYYLNTTFYDSLEDKEFIVDSNWYTGTNTIADLNYQLAYKSNKQTKIGMLRLSELFVGEVPNVLTISPGIESGTVIMVINEKNSAFGDFIATKYNIRPALNLKNDIDIYSGTGTSEDPYIISVKQESVPMEE